MFSIQAINVESRHYGGNISIIKLECIGHVQKHTGTQLQRLKTKLKRHKLSDNCKQLSGSGRLTDAVNLQVYYGKAIRKNSSDVNKMKTAVWTTYFHLPLTNKNYNMNCVPTGEVISMVPDLWRKVHAQKNLF